jgi:hypothetical protein
MRFSFVGTVHRLFPRAAVLVVATALSASAQSSGSESYPERCGAGLFPAERGHYLALPHGDVFCSLIADPKAMRSFASYQKGRATDLASDILAVGIADQFPFFRAAAIGAGNGVQLGLSGAVFAQFDLRSASYDLLNADYLIALPLTFRAGPFSGRARVYHQSSHLGDEFVLRPNAPARENLSFESADLLLSMDVTVVRLYGGGEYFFHRDPSELADKLIHSGIELRPHGSVNFGAVAVARFIAAADVKVVNDSTWRTGVSVRAGFEFARPRDTDFPSRRWSLLAEYYNGPSPYGQFHRSNVKLTGVGFQFAL